MVYYPVALASRVVSRQPPGIRALLLLAAVVSLYAVYGSLRFYRDPLSIFFSSRHGFDQFYSAVRKAEADAFLDAAYLADPGLMARAGDAPAMCAVFITVGRKMEEEEEKEEDEEEGGRGRRHYLDTALGSFLANMTRQEREEIHLKLFFADMPDPETQHPSFFRLRGGGGLAGLADEIFSIASTLPPSTSTDRRMAELAALAADRGNRHALRRKTVHDYAYAMDRCVRTTTAPYIALVEDDVLLADGWAARTLLNLRAVEQMMADPRRLDPQRGRVEPGRPNSWLYLRLFNQERSTGWAGGVGFRSNNVHVISAVVALPLLKMLLVARRRRRALARHLDGWTLAVICGLAVPLSVWLFFASGKASLLGPPRPGVHEEFFGCCNQALVYNREHAGALAESMLHAVGSHPGPILSDMLPKMFAYDRGLARVSAYPMLAQHLGRVSSIENTGDEARHVWSAAFEDLQPERLAAQHAKDVRELFGDDAWDQKI